MLKLCKHCGKQFSAAFGNELYCDDFCRTYKYLIKRKGNQKKVCVVCGKQFYSHQTKCKFCSTACHDKFHDSKVYITILCAQCGNPFKTSTRKKKYCTKNCYRVAKSIREAAGRTK